MSTAVYLLLYSLAVTTFGPGLLRRLTAGGHAPRLSVAVWLTLIASVGVCLPASATLLTIEFVEHTIGSDRVLSSCLSGVHDVLLGRHGATLRAIGWSGAAVVGVTISATAIRLARTLGGLRDRSHEHAAALRIVGRSMDGDIRNDVVVMDTADRLAYCVPGRPATIVVTTGALDALDEPQLAAVLAHERAHLAGRHGLLLALLQGLAAVLPRVALLRAAAIEVPTLLEMCADDVAARRHGRGPLLGGLLALAGAAPSPGLAAAGLAVLARAERLSGGAQPRARARALLGGAMAVVASGPVAVTMLAVTGALLCTP